MCIRDRREYFITDFMLLPPWARAPQSPSEYEEAAQCTASFYAIRGEWTTTESHSLRFIQNARVSKFIPGKKGDFMGESHCFSAGRLVIENYKSPNIALEPYLCILSGQNQFYWESVSYRIRFPCAASAQGLLTAWVHTRSGDICYKTDRETAEDKMINYWIPFS